MVLESDLAERAGIAQRGTLERIREAVRAAGLPTRRPPDVTPAQLLAGTRADKKARRGAVEYALPCRVGAMAGEDRGWACPVADDLVLEVLA
jgi:3-dehydroquinate synthetase